MAPRNEKEAALSRIWAEVLDIDPVGVRDSFFDLGGDSLRAGEATAAIVQRLECELPPDAILAAPTIEQLAAVLDSAEPSQGQASISLSAKSVRPELFCVTLTGGTDHLRLVLNYLGGDQPVHGLEVPAAGDVEDVPGSMHDLAGRLVERIKQEQPLGPYFLCGYAYAGVPAFEAARQLAADGDEVGLLALIDSFAPGAHPRRLPLARRLLRYAWLLLNFFDEETWQYVRHRAQRARSSLAKRLRRRRATPQDLGRVGREAAPATTAPDVKACEALGRALAGYVPEHFPGRITLFQAASRGQSRRATPLGGWAGLATRIQVEQIPGDQHELLEEPQAQMLGEKLACALASARADAARPRPRAA